MLRQTKEGMKEMFSPWSLCALWPVNRNGPRDPGFSSKAHGVRGSTSPIGPTG